VEWVHQNIAAFGGDPAKVTIFGQSSGGVAADWWTFAYRDSPLVSGIISESGNAFSFPLNARELQVRNWYNMSATLGCGSSGDTLACVRGKDWRDVLAAAAKLPAAPGGNPVRSTPAFYPTVDNETVFSGYASLLEQGRFAKIVSRMSITTQSSNYDTSLTTSPQPQLLGNNDYEQGYYVIPAYGRGINTTLAQRDQFLLESSTCPNDFEARARTAHGVSVWQYRYFGDWPNTRLYPTSGAYHGTELQMLFGNSKDVSGTAPGAAQVRLTQVMQSAWVAFARDPVGGLEGIGWPKYDLDGETLVRLGYGNSDVVDLVRPEVYSGNCSDVVLVGGQ
jgi:cholinesterase